MTAAEELCYYNSLDMLVRVSRSKEPCITPRIREVILEAIRLYKVK